MRYGCGTREVSGIIGSGYPGGQNMPTESTRDERLDLIRQIEQARQSKVICYLTGDRQGAPGAQIGEDAVRPMYAHLRSLAGEIVPRLDLFLYSRGGSVEVPWRIVSMFREHCEEFNVLIPYKAHSAATLIALGADQIAMGRKGELGPIDPSLNRVERMEQTVMPDSVSVEDVMAYIAFLKERAGLGDQSALAGAVAILAEKLNPWVVGSIYRAHSHIRLVARKLLGARRSPHDEQANDLIVEALSEKMYAHGHAIGRHEAKEIRLQVNFPDASIEELMWQLFEHYEALLALNDPLDIDSAIPEGEEELTTMATLACLESLARTDLFRGDLRLRRIRQMPPQLNLNVNLNLALPPNIARDKVPPALQQAVQELLNQAQAQITQMVQAEVHKQAPVKGTEARLLHAGWQDVTHEHP
ncbi:MAG: hypothetical protein COZ06_17725 [Armatimonadetes bacterium CG_4_10_14_3_um_filter_66_18]|nr:MAG: hypothetical protein COS65_28345 [Armatimonadetes bacterium CG06_land_8_20_14_3_00_66_21]PIY47493.1 MAG: hypothetical protein COZ06_17725 [Armatimonadetes bacterium CG_4_10_14_3_um_filter_66_18]